MLNKIRKSLKDKAGFTLVELIVVLVILAILAALLVPALTGYIKKANQQKSVAATRQVVMAAQTEISTLYSTGAINAEDNSVNADTKATIAALAEVDSTKIGEIKYNMQGKITSVTYNGNPTCVYDGQVYKIGDEVVAGTPTPAPAGE